MLVAPPVLTCSRGLKKIRRFVVGLIKLGDVSDFRMKGLRFQYRLTSLVTIPLGSFVMLLPGPFQDIAGMERQDHTFFGISGSVYTAFGILSLFAMRDPKKWSPILMLQLTYKLLWFACVMGLRGKGKDNRWPDYAMLAGYAVFVAGDLLSVPVEYLFSEKK